MGDVFLGLFIYFWEHSAFGLIVGGMTERICSSYVHLTLTEVLIYIWVLVFIIPSENQPHSKPSNL